MTANYYKIVHDENELDRFINWLPDLKENEQFYWSLFARKKYCADVNKSNDKTQLKRGTCTKTNLKDKLQQLEVQFGSLKLKNIPAPQESLVAYIMPNPRCMVKATWKTAKHCMDLLENTNKGYNLHQEVMSCIQQSKSYSFVVDFDVDQKEDIDLSLLDSQIFQQQERPYNIIETRGGYHILVQPQLVDKDNKTWYNKISKLYPVDQSADQMIPIPGCIQGGFIPRIII